MAKKRIHIKPYTVRSHYRNVNVKSKSASKQTSSVWVGARDFVHYPSRNLLYKIYKSEAEGPYANVMGVLYVKQGKKRLAFTKNRDDFIKDIKKGIAKKVDSKQGTSLIILYSGNGKPKYTVAFFEDIIRKAKNPSEAHKKIGQIKNVPYEVSKRFRKKWDPKEELTTLEVTKKIWNKFHK